MAEDGRNFNCEKCPKAVQNLRRCWEPRWDFTEADNPQVFPIQVSKGGEQYGFCPGKVFREPDIAQLFYLLMISAETGAMMKAGGLEDQPDWFIDLLGWFIPRFDIVKFTSKANMILGGSSSKDAHKAFAASVAGGKQRASHQR